jgi:ribonucleoside-diphosphate reductase alpha chain
MDAKKPTIIDLSENAITVLKERHLKKNDKGEPIVEPLEMFRRVAGAVAEAEIVFADGDGSRGTQVLQAGRA